MTNEHILVKICGLTNLEDAIFSRNAGADILGVVMSDRSPRRGTSSFIQELAGRGFDTAGVYTELETVMKDASAETYIQLHFQHGRKEIEYVKKNLNKKVISVIFPHPGKDIRQEAEERIHEGADLALIDYGSDVWESASEKFPDLEETRIGVAGKVSADNLQRVIQLNPYFIDLSSMLEISPGKKDHVKIRHFMEVLKLGKAAL